MSASRCTWYNSGAGQFVSALNGLLVIAAQVAPLVCSVILLIRKESLGQIKIQTLEVTDAVLQDEIQRLREDKPYMSEFGTRKLVQRVRGLQLRHLAKVIRSERLAYIKRQKEKQRLEHPELVPTRPKGGLGGTSEGATGDGSVAAAGADEAGAAEADGEEGGGGYGEGYDQSYEEGGDWSDQGYYDEQGNWVWYEEAGEGGYYQEGEAGEWNEQGRYGYEGQEGYDQAY